MALVRPSYNFVACWPVLACRTSGRVCLHDICLELPSRTYPYLFLENGLFVCHLISDKKQWFSFQCKNYNIRVQNFTLQASQQFTWLKYLEFRTFPLDQSQRTNHNIDAGIAHFRWTIIYKQQDISENLEIFLWEILNFFHSCTCTFKVGSKRERVSERKYKLLHGEPSWSNMAMKFHEWDGIVYPFKNVAKSGAPGQIYLRGKNCWHKHAR